MTMDARFGGLGEEAMAEKVLPPRMRRETSTIEVGLSAAIIAVRDNEPEVLTVRSEQDTKAPYDALPFGSFSPIDHRTLERGLRAWVQERTGLALGYVEQLYTFGDRGRSAVADDKSPHIVSIGYLAFTRPELHGDIGPARWRSWYDFFPWEDWRNGKPSLLSDILEPKLIEWANRSATTATTSRPGDRHQRLRITFGMDGGSWDEEKVLERYELLYEAGLVEESYRDGQEAASEWGIPQNLGAPMHFDHRRILATSIGRTRAKIKYRPVVFELMPSEFTLFELQKTVEAILGPHLHKQNFRRLVESAGLVETTGEVRAKTGGRPAKLYRFRREVLLERPAPGVRVKPSRA